MTTTVHYPELAETVRAQRTRVPSLYGDFDFDTGPYRLTTDPEVPSALPKWVGDRNALLDDEQAVELVRTATFLADAPADAYAALCAERSVTDLIGMVRTACNEGLDAVVDAPPELAVFIDDLLSVPDWIDMDLVAEGARLARVDAALVSPFITRGAFIATFTNTYAALPMALTGALSGKRAAHRVNETASFFAVTTLPGALDPGGPGFEAAAMVRLMHSMVRYNALRRSEHWDPAVYGLPIPQLDQMPAGLMGLYVLAQQVLRKGRTEFSDDERPLVEFGRYRCFLLGLPEELVPSQPDDVVRLFNARAAMLRDDFDDTTCGQLVRSTMAAYLRPTESWYDRLADDVERTFSKAVFTAAFCQGSLKRATRMGLTFEPADAVRLAFTAPFIVGRFLALSAAAHNRFLRGPADRYLVQTVKKRLATYGRPEFKTDAETYTPTV